MSNFISSLYSGALVNSPREQLLRPLAFDFWLIPGITILALAAGLICVSDPYLFATVLFLDLWILGYHHVVSTYTRICFDLKSVKENAFFVFYLPFLVAIPCTILFYTIGPWILATTYLYWQWFHYTRQSYGISRIYSRKSAPTSEMDEKACTLALYAIPLLGILYRSWEAPERFLGLELKVLPVSWEVVQISGALALVAFLWWMYTQFKQIQNRTFSRARFLYLGSHHLIFLVSYLFIDDINIGWLVVNIWHNAQYILIVWLYNNNKFRDGVSEEQPFLSSLSQSENWIRYTIVCLLLSTAMYAGLSSILSQYQSTVVPVAMIVYSVINFHHYIVDGIIWKVRKKEVRQHLVTDS